MKIGVAGREGGQQGVNSVQVLGDGGAMVTRVRNRDFGIFVGGGNIGTPMFRGRGTGVASDNLVGVRMVAMIGKKHGSTPPKGPTTGLWGLPGEGDGCNESLGPQLQNARCRVQGIDLPKKAETGITAEWALSNKTKNRLTHAYNGNSAVAGGQPDLPRQIAAVGKEIAMVKAALGLPSDENPGAYKDWEPQQLRDQLTELQKKENLLLAQQQRVSASSAENGWRISARLILKDGESQSFRGRLARLLQSQTVSAFGKCPPLGATDSEVHVEFFSSSTDGAGKIHAVLQRAIADCKDEFSSTHCEVVPAAQPPGLTVWSHIEGERSLHSGEMDPVNEGQGWSKGTPDRGQNDDGVSSTTRERAHHRPQDAWPREVRILDESFGNLVDKDVRDATTRIRKVAHSLYDDFYFFFRLKIHNPQLYELVPTWKSTAGTKRVENEMDVAEARWQYGQATVALQKAILYRECLTRWYWHGGSAPPAALIQEIKEKMELDF
uniref:Uncharacterized protein n=1 Tax=Chromera velia CCMP2878 TaxID=1169474 RepID=A0A0G4GE18_9ALVE|eukprot:Cvel_21457.t1-p1 / transcript=Cvel_21457.t1 / gene=Cvel_21457 / organism=Chromera_velia_CCMP2878 / gene_product=hypothetical protein / transcript_product=hypothetical protein / location=Cvel_scaffold2014:13477-17131(-) / protein_length=493 / sequence_SO=supercontig / SO=protein_coding / is_pseudo=false